MTRIGAAAYYAYQGVFQPGILELRFGEHPAVATTADSEPLDLVIGA